MIEFPVCEQLRIDGYGLYPGRNDDHLLDIGFGPGLTLVLGANGLGKTTLISILFRLLTGPNDLRSGSGDSLGTTALHPAELGRERKREFAARVRDGAEHASATLTFVLGDTRFTVTRALSSLRLTSLKRDGESMSSADEAAYQRVVCDAAGVHAFGDFLLVLRHLMFFFEDRRSLVWDASAQRQILRALFLPPADARRWSELERIALSLDSELRNTNALLTRNENKTGAAKRREGNASEVRVQIEAHNALQATDVARQELLGERATELDALLTRQRLDVLRAEQQADAEQRGVERAQLSVIERSFPSIDQSMRYIFAQLVSDGVCRACGQPSEASVQRMHRNLENRQCAICDLPLTPTPAVTSGELAIERVERARDSAAQSQQQLGVAQRAYRETAEEYRTVQDELAQISATIDQRHRELNSLYHQLPPEEAALREQETVLALPDLDTAEGLRDRACLELFYATGIRRTELANLHQSDLDRTRGTLHVRLGKGKKDRFVPVGERALAWIGKYEREARPELLADPLEKHLFLNQYGQPLSPDGLSWRVRDYFRQAGIDKRGACHLFRHTMATAMLDNGADIRHVQEILGHGQITSTQRYTHVSIARLQAVHAATHPAAKLERRHDPDPSPEEA